MNEQDIYDLINSVVEKRSEKWGYNQMALLMPWLAKDKVVSYPNYYPTYGLAIELMESCRVHAEKGCFPYKLFINKSPFQSDEELQYIRDNYKQVTLTFGVDFINTIARSFSDGNFSIKYAEDKPAYLQTGETLQKYLDTGINTYGSLDNWMKFVFVSLKTTDANGVIAIKPDLQYDIDEEGSQTISKVKLNEPQIYYFDCSKVVAYKEEEYCLVETTVYSTNKKGTGYAKVNEYTYELYDTQNIYVITYDANKKSTTIKLYYAHNLGFLPTTKIKGVPRIIDGEVLWQSVFSFVTDILDIIAMDSSTLQISKHKCAYPTRVYEGRPCDFSQVDPETNDTRQCINGSVLWGESLTARPCTKCNGTGLLDRFSALRDFLTAPSSSLDPVRVNPDPFKYVAPDSDILKYLEDSIAKNEAKAAKILHLQTSNTVIRGTDNLTATGMTLDQKSMFAFIKPVSDQMFDVRQFITDVIGMMRYGKDNYTAPTITKPNTFDFQTEYDYINEIGAAITSGLPPFIIQTILERYLKSHFYSDHNTAFAFNLIINVDRLLGSSNNDIAIQQSKGLVADWEIVFHTSGISIVKDMLLANEKFFELSIDKQKEQVIAEAKRIATEAKPVGSSTASAIQNILKPVA